MVAIFDLLRSCELGIVVPPAAIGNAIAGAVGVRLTELPMNPERVFWAIKGNQKGPSEGR